MSDLLKDNIFNIDHPNEWICSVESFSNTHNILRVRLKNTKDNSLIRYLTFRKVSYFTGWMSWTGANFVVASDEECYALLNKGVNEEQQLDREIYRFSNVRLFQVQGNDGKYIQIIANAGGFENPEGKVFSTFPNLQ